MSDSKNKWRNTKPTWSNTISIKPRTGSLTIEQIGLRFSDVKHYSSNDEKNYFDNFDSQRCKRMFDFIPDTIDYLSGNYKNSQFTDRAERLSIINGNIWQVGHYLQSDLPFAKNDELSKIILKNKQADFSTFLAATMYIKAKEKNFPLLDADIIAPVPNFDTNLDVKAVSIAKKLTEIINNESFQETKPIYQNVLNKKINKETKKMSYNEKKIFYATNQVYELNSKFDVHGKNIILIDDIVTAGFTAEQCIKKLLEHGASKVNFYATATTKNRRR